MRDKGIDNGNFTELQLFPSQITSLAEITQFSTLYLPLDEFTIFYLLIKVYHKWQVNNHTPAYIVNFMTAKERKVAMQNFMGYFTDILENTLKDIDKIVITNAVSAIQSFMRRKYTKESNNELPQIEQPI